MTDLRAESTVFRMPAEWAPHAATWIAWPHHEPDWPKKLEAVKWAYAEIVRVLAQHEFVNILCQNQQIQEEAEDMLEAHDVNMNNAMLYVSPTDRVWLRDSGPTFVHLADGSVQALGWEFNAWAKYHNYAQDREVPDFIQQVTGVPLLHPVRTDGSNQMLVLEGGGIDVNGAGRILVTEEWLLSDEQVRNPGMSREDYERAFASYLGCHETIWLGNGCVGDDTHGHVDDVARFVRDNVVVLAYEDDPEDANHASSVDNYQRLQAVGDLEIVKLPYPRPVIMDGARLPASYANFYIANGVVIVPTFNDVNDRVALQTLAELFPGREVVGIHAVDLVWGYGTLHCLTQQEPARR